MEPVWYSSGEILQLQKTGFLWDILFFKVQQDYGTRYGYAMTGCGNKIFTHKLSILTSLEIVAQTVDFSQHKIDVAFLNSLVGNDASKEVGVLA